MEGLIIDSHLRPGRLRDQKQRFAARILQGPGPVVYRHRRANDIRSRPTISLVLACDSKEEIFAVRGTLEHRTCRCRPKLPRHPPIRWHAIDWRFMAVKCRLARFASSLLIPNAVHVLGETAGHARGLCSRCQSDTGHRCLVPHPGSCRSARRRWLVACLLSSVGWGATQFRPRKEPNPK